jgi:hypothetical protein
MPGQVAVLGMEDHRQVEGGRVVQRAGQGAGVGEAVQAVAEGHAAGIAQGDQLGQLLAFQALAQGADRVHLAVPGFTGAVQDQLGDCRGVEHRPGLRRAAQAGHATGGGGAGFAGDAALAAVAGLAQGNAQVDQAGRGHQAGGVQGTGGLEAGRGSADGDDLAGVDVQVADLVQAAGWVDDTGAEDTQAHWAFSCSN